MQHNSRIRGTKLFDEESKSDAERNRGTVRPGRKREDKSPTPSVNRANRECRIEQEETCGPDQRYPAVEKLIPTWR